MYYRRSAAAKTVEPMLPKTPSQKSRAVARKNLKARNNKADESDDGDEPESRPASPYNAPKASPVMSVKRGRTTRKALATVSNEPASKQAPAAVKPEAKTRAKQAPRQETLIEEVVAQAETDLPRRKTRSKDRKIAPTVPPTTTAAAVEPSALASPKLSPIKAVKAAKEPSPAIVAVPEVIAVAVEEVSVAPKGKGKKAAAEK